METAQKRYYWIKLKDSFITSDAVDFLMAQPNGAEYVVLYQMLCLKTVNTNGELARQIGEIIIPYDIEKIQRDTKFFKLDTIRVALELYKRLGLVYEQENGILKITDFSNLVGGEASSAKRVREHRERKRLKQEQERELLALQCNGESNTRVTQEKEIRDKRIDIRDNIKDSFNTLGQKLTESENEIISIESLFDAFWQNYPRKVSKANAFKAYKTAVKGLKGQALTDMANTILKGLECYIVVCKGRDVQYISHASSWLNGKRWEDDNSQNKKQEPACEYDFSKYQL